jgi:plasmid stabilization system protein ParE
MRIEILSAAEDELADAISYYNEQSEGLGYEFAAEIDQTFARILQFPDAWFPLSPRTRRCRAKRFPYGVIYQVRSDIILVVAIMHMRRHPDSWKKRLSSKA